VDFGESRLLENDLQHHHVASCDGRQVICTEADGAEFRSLAGDLGFQSFGFIRQCGNGARIDVVVTSRRRSVTVAS
jgi:hypothetical protein